MSTVSLTIAGLTLTTVAVKAAGPVALGGRELPPRLALVLAALAPVVLASLVTFLAVGDSPAGITVDARVPGVAAAVVALALRAPLLVVLLVAAGVAAAARLLGMA